MSRRLAAPLATALAVVAIWEIAVRVLAVPAYLLPPPSAVARAADLDLLRHAAVTLGEALAGVALASALAFAAALAFVRAPVLERGLLPLAIALKTTPLVAIAPLLVLWLGTGWASKVVAAALISFFPVLVNAVKGLRAADAEYFELFQSLGARPGQVFRRLRIPFCLPYLFAALKISSSLAVVGAIVGEFVGATQGLGYLIMLASAHLDTDVLFAAIAAAAGAGIVLFEALAAIERRCVFWQRVEAD